MEVVEDTPMTPVPKDVTEAIRIRRTEIRNIENEAENRKRENPYSTPSSTMTLNTQLLTSSEIRKFRNQGQILETDEALGE